MHRLRFLHIPKTAGTSLADCLKRIYGGERACFRFTGDLEADLQRYRQHPHKQRIRLVVGHAPFRTGLPQIDRLPTITLLRHPVERVKSYCQHVADGKSAELADRFPPAKFCLDRFLASGEPQLDNLQVRMLLGDYLGPIDESNQTAKVRQAIEILADELAGFGLAERFEETLLLWKQCFGWPWPTFLHLNRRRGRPLRFSREHLQRIVALNRADMELYQTAAAIFRQRLDRQRPQIEHWQRCFRRRQQLFCTYGWIYPLAEKFRRRLSARAA